jgi:hypothetical protein
MMLFCYNMNITVYLIFVIKKTTKRILEFTIPKIIVVLNTKHCGLQWCSTVFCLTQVFFLLISSIFILSLFGIGSYGLLRLALHRILVMSRKKSNTWYMLNLAKIRFNFIDLKCLKL